MNLLHTVNHPIQDLYLCKYNSNMYVIFLQLPGIFLEPVRSANTKEMIPIMHIDTPIM